MSSMIMTGEGAAFFINGKPYNCSSDHENFQLAFEAASRGDWDQIPALISLRAKIEEYINVSDTIKVNVDHITYKGKRIHGVIVDKILAMIAEGLNAQPMINFLENLYQNPSDVAVNELYLFLVSAKLPITEDGHFLAYKKVNRNYTSCYDNKTPNIIGTELVMERFEVNSDRHQTCSNGYHFCSFDYLTSFGGERTLILKINPRDVVTIPSDYNNTKGRACRYLIEGEVDQVSENLLGQVGSVVKSSAEVPTADKYPNSTTFKADSTASTDTVLGYDAGYRLGRYGTEPIASDSYSEDYTNAFTQGRIDGKGHKVRKYSTPKSK